MLAKVRKSSQYKDEDEDKDEDENDDEDEYKKENEACDDSAEAELF